MRTVSILRVYIILQSQFRELNSHYLLELLLEEVMVAIQPDEEVSDTTTEDTSDEEQVFAFALFAWLISRTFSANEQYFSLPTNQPTVLLVTAE